MFTSARYLAPEQARESAHRIHPIRGPRRMLDRDIGQPADALEARAFTEDLNA